ncbi:MAG TPA: glycosyltransferase family 4 protein [Longimicrobiaceae bacterium]|nr:glycosyltransferase family 4 protein [Longimicrobiaceae bacterium]
MTDAAAAARPLRVLFVIAYPHRNAGANRSLFELVTHLPPSVRPLVLVTEEGAVSRLYRAAGVEVAVLPVGGALGTFGGRLARTSAWERARTALGHLLPFTLRLRRLIRRAGVELVHVNDARAALLAAPAARLARRPVVAHLRGEFPFGRAGRLLFARAADRIVAVSEGARRSLGPAGMRKSVVVYNGIGSPRPGPPIPFLRALRERGVVVAGCFASVVPFKGQHHLIEALARLNARGWRDRLAVVCVGDFPAGHEAYHAHLQRLCAEHGIDNLTFAGWQDDPFAFYPQVDLTVLPSVTCERLALDGRELEVRGSEGFPRTHLEAMSFGLPVVGTRIAGVPEQVADGETGLLAPPGDPAALADALERLLESPELRARLGAAGKARVARLFSTEAYVAGVMEVFTALAGARGAR